jgi:hypothetical protein
LLFIVSGASFLSKKLKNKNSSENLNKKPTPWIRDPEKIHPGSQIPDPGGKKAPDLGSGSATLNECMSIAELLNRKGEEV